VEKSLIYLFMFVVLCSPALSEMKYGQLNILSENKDALVILDGEKEGAPPIKIKNIVVGNHHLKVVDPNKYITLLDKSIDIFEGQLTTILLDNEILTTGTNNNQKISLTKKTTFSLANQMQYNSEKKDPGTATILSFLIPGLGQFYNGDSGKGMGFLAGYVISYAVMTQRSTTGYYYSSTTYPNAGIGALGILVCWGWSMGDAYGSAEEKNEHLKTKYGITLRNYTPVFQVSCSL